MRFSTETRYESQVIAAMVFSGLVGSSPVLASSFKYTPLNSNGGIPATPSGINSQDVVVGQIGPYGNPNTEGFVWVAGKLTTVKGVGTLSAVNDDGTAVGWVNRASNDFFTYNVSTGVLTRVPVPFNIGTRAYRRARTEVFSINTAGEAVGMLETADNPTVGFTWLNGVATKIVPPEQTQGSVPSINDKGDIVINSSGGYDNYYNPYVYKNGKFTQLVVPDGWQAYATFITNSGLIGGSFGSDSSTVGFVSNGDKYTVYTAFGAPISTVTGVGPLKQVYGTFSPSYGIAHGFVNVAGTFYQIDFPGAATTQILGVGTSGTIFGIYGNNQGDFGFIATCPKKDVCTQ